jgi:hypothetical protein
MSATAVHVVARGSERFGVEVTEGDTTTSHEMHVQTDVGPEVQRAFELFGEDQPVSGA